MLNLDKKDLQIIEILAKNCRVPRTTLAQALHVSKDTIRYRIHRLESEGYISQYVLFVDARTLGFTRYHILISFDELTDKEETYRKLSEHPYVMWINTFIGRFDIQIIVDATDGFHLNKIRQELFTICENKIKEYIILTHLCDLEFTQLNPLLMVNTPIQTKNDFSFSSLLFSRNFPVKQAFTLYKPDAKEIDILNALADQPNKSLVALSRALTIDRITTKKKITLLIEQKRILNFGAIPNLSKLGFVTYYLLVRVAQQTPFTVLQKPFLHLQNIFYAGQMIGDYDMILYLNARNPQELNESISLFRREIEKFILRYDLLVQDKVHHWRQFSKGIYSLLKEKGDYR